MWPLPTADILSVGPLLQIPHMHVPGVVYLMKRSELGLAAWCLGSWWCVLWFKNKFPCRICPRSPATTDLLVYAGSRRWHVRT
jgi:hypothetical protein